jgi:hypothetical protein
VPYPRHKVGGILGLFGTQSEQVVNKGRSVRYKASSCLASVKRELIHKYELNETTVSRVFPLSSDSQCRGSVPVSSVQKSVPVRSVHVSGVRVSGVPSRLRSSSTRSAFALSVCESRQSPREVLAFAMNELRRVAEAKKGKRIARRLATLAEGKHERVTWLSRKSLRGVH